MAKARGQESQPAESSREYAIKAAFIYNFAHYVQWPAAAGDEEFVIGVLGPSPFGSTLDEVAATKRIEGRRIAIRQFASMADYRPCQILFLTAAEKQERLAIEQTHGLPVLLVAEDLSLSGQGIVIDFFLEENKVRFEIDAEAARRRQLKISSRLLSLSKRAGG